MNSNNKYVYVSVKGLRPPEHHAVKYYLKNKSNK